jgi:thiamine-phosphate pyrophosphorylase
MSILYAITDSQLMPGEQLYTGVEAALKGGCRLVQYRDKSNDHRQRLIQARRLLALCNQYQARLLINDDLRLAHEVGAHGVHLGQDDESPATARELLGNDAIIGVTCHASLTLAEKAIEQRASYVAFGRFFPSKTKPDAPPAPLALLQQARQVLGDTPIVAIGGITLANAASVLEAGASMIAVSFSLFGASDISQQARAYTALQRSG